MPCLALIFHPGAAPVSSKSVQEALALEKQDDLVHDGAHGLLLAVHDQVRLGGCLVRVVDTGEALDLAGARLLVDPPLVGLLAVLQRVATWTR